jgi:hypothetical protein
MGVRAVWWFARARAVKIEDATLEEALTQILTANQLSLQGAR